MWDEVVRRYGPFVWRIARAAGATPAEAADVCQTTWLRLFERVGEIRRPGSLQAWLSTTAWREARRVTRLRRGSVALQGLFELPEVAPGPEDLLADMEHEPAGPSPIERLRPVIERLPPLQRQLFELIQVAPPLSQRDIGRLLEISPNYVGVMKSRLLAKLRRCLEASADDGSAPIPPRRAS